MDGIANVAKQQQSQVSSAESQGRAVQQTQQTQSATEVSKQIAQEAQKNDTQINSPKDVENLVNELNKALEPMSTNLKFGVDSQDVFYVSVVESQTNKIIRRFPAEKAESFLPKMQEVSGILFDTRG